MKTLAELTEREILALAIAQDYFSRDFPERGSPLLARGRQVGHAA